MIYNEWKFVEYFYNQIKQISLTESVILAQNRFRILFVENRIETSVNNYFKARSRPRGLKTSALDSVEINLFLF